MPLDPNVDYEHLPPGDRFDETAVNLRHYLCQMTDEKLAEYDREWPDEHVVEWCGDFTDEGNLFLCCSERDIEVEEFRAVLEEHLKHRRLEVI